MDAVGAEVGRRLRSQLGDREARAGRRRARAARAPAMSSAYSSSVRWLRSGARLARTCAPGRRGCRAAASPCRRPRGEPLPRVDPVEDPARGDLGGVGVRRHLARSTTPSSRSHASGSAARRWRGRVREVEPASELDPLDPPLLVLGQAGASQSGSAPSARVSPATVKRPGDARRRRSRGRGARARSRTAPGAGAAATRGHAQRLPEQLGEPARQPLAVEALATVSRAAPREPVGERGVVVQAQQRVGERLGVLGRRRAGR